MDNVNLIIIIIFIIVFLVLSYFILSRFIIQQELGTVGSICNTTSQCLYPLLCLNGTCQPNNNANNSNIGNPCDAQNCQSGTTCLPILTSYCNGIGVCQCGTGTTINSSCNSTSDCLLGLYCNTNNICVNNLNAVIEQCNDINCPSGSFCNFNRNCQIGNSNILANTNNFKLNPSNINNTGLQVSNNLIIYSNNPSNFNYINGNFIFNNSNLMINKQGYITLFNNSDFFSSILNIYITNNNTLYITDQYGNSSMLKNDLSGNLVFYDPIHYNNDINVNDYSYLSYILYF